jgi:FAD:protein FMN transferase
MFRAMGCEVVVAGADRRSLAAIRRLFAARDAMFSRFRPDSELCSVNRAAGRLTCVSRPFADVVSCALGMAAQTGGLVDPTVGGSLVALGYGRDFGELGDDPSPAGPVAAAVGWHQVTLTGLVLRMPAGCALDLNGVVKAATVDEAAGLLPDDGFVSAGGDLAVRGAQDVALPGGDAVRVIHGGVATAGTSRRRWRRGGAWYHHLIDSATGLPAESPWREVTASGATCLAADVGARAALLAGEDGPDWLDRRGIPGRLVAVDGRVRINETWAAMTGVGLCT